jgi:hypothetical protein
LNKVALMLVVALYKFRSIHVTKIIHCLLYSHCMYICFTRMSVVGGNPKRKLIISEYEKQLAPYNVY